jgi:hypothetical protein
VGKTLKFSKYMPGARLELAREVEFPTDFKSVASADSAIRASKKWRRGAELNRRISVLQTDALPLCYRAVKIGRENGATRQLAKGLGLTPSDF